NAAASASIAPATGGTTGSAPSASSAPAPTNTGPAPNAANVSSNSGSLSCDSSGNFPIYTIQPGDTLSGVAVKFGLGNGDVPGWKLIVDSNKPDLVDEDDLLQIEQKLLIPIQGCKNPAPAPSAAATASTSSSSSTSGTADKPASSTSSAAASATAPTTNSASSTSSTAAATAAQP